MDFLEKKKKTGANIPEYKGTILPPPPCKPAKKELPEAGAYLEYVDYSGPAIRRISKDNTEYFTRSCKKTITTKEELESGNQDN